MPANHTPPAQQRPNDGTRQLHRLAERLSALAARAGLGGVFDALGQGLRPLAPLAEALWLIAEPALSAIDTPTPKSPLDDFPPRGRDA